MASTHNRVGRLAGMVLAAGWLAAAASAQSVMYITPEHPEVATGESVVVAAEKTAGQRIAWPADRLTWMFVRHGGGQWNYDSATAVAEPGQEGPVITLEGLDSAMVGVEFAPRDETLDGKALVAWAKQNIAAGNLPPGLDTLEQAGEVIVRRVESAKTFVRARGDGEQRRGSRPARSATTTDKSGQAVEIRPLMDVTAATTPTDMPVRMYAFGDGAKRCQLRVVHVPTGEEQVLAADDKAIAFVRLERPGVYRMEFHAMKAYTPPDIPEEGKPASKAAWTLHSGTATFTVPQQPQVAQNNAAPTKGAEPAKGEEKSR